MNQQELWNKKFSRDGYLYGTNPNQFIKNSYVNFKKDQTVLCLGEGEGRNAIFLAKEGFDVEAIDASDIGLNKLFEQSKIENVEIKTACMDINDWQVSKKYGAILFSFLHLKIDELKTLIKKIETSLEKDGFFVCEVFSKNQIENNSGGPKDLELLYSMHDFKENIKELKIHKLEEVITNLEEGTGHQGEASVIRLIAQKS
ncbi:methyltransferase domain-containing protein [Arcobacter sp. F2176]|uniref:class I SAM-dependent methyltransferase n=1 Tax=Arcobacter sp. F2176 TaxID=2044511 RepID=UPI00100ACEA7|nr:methyltransferase domain-containing protein [Arcobacter sp. F2176]RXJ80842.1 tellurium resistance protein [Arcobacter sp. F2176]